MIMSCTQKLVLFPFSMIHGGLGAGDGGGDGGDGGGDGAAGGGAGGRRSTSSWLTSGDSNVHSQNWSNFSKGNGANADFGNGAASSVEAMEDGHKPHVA